MENLQPGDVLAVYQKRKLDHHLRIVYLPSSKVTKAMESHDGMLTWKKGYHYWSTEALKEGLEEGYIVRVGKGEAALTPFGI